MFDLSIFASSDAYEAGQSAGRVMGMILGFVLILGVPAFFVVSLIKALTTKTKGWITALVVSSLMLVSGGAFVVYSGYSAYKKGAGQSQLNGSSKDGTKTVQTDDQLLQFELPAKWKPIDELHEEASLKYGNLRNEHYMLVLTEPKVDFGEDVSLKEYAGLCMQNAELAASDIKLGEWSEMENDYGTMREIEMSATVDRIKIKYQYGYYETKNHFHQIMQWTLPSKWESSQPVFHDVLKSVKPVKAEDYFKG